MATPTTDPTLDIDDRRNCEIEATVVTGFENIARTEALQKVPYSNVRCERGRIFITTTMAGVQKVLALSSIDNCYVVMSRFPDVILSQNQLEIMRTIRELVRTVDWENGLRAWQRVFTFEHPVLYRPEVVPESLGEPVIVQRKNSGKKRKLDGTESATKENCEENSKDEKETDVSSKIEKQDKDVPQNSEQPGVKNSTIKDKLGEDSIHSETDQSKEGSKKATDPTNEQPERVRQTPHDPTKLTFRVTCNRTGDHCFQSMCAAANFGGAVYAYFNWNIDMKNFDVEVILNIDGSNVNVGIALTKESLHRRNIAHFGPTTLRPTIAFNMLRMCNIRPGDVICDPMCGGGTIPIEASVNWPDCVHLCGEIHAIGAGRSRDNIDTLNAKRIQKDKPPVKVDVLRWDASAMPLGESSVDVFISDLPFGKRIGHKVDNWKLYPSSMLEMARVCRPETGRACFLTHDKRCMIKTIHGLKKFWRQVRSVGVNIGGLSAVVFLLYRTAKTVSPEDVAPTADVLRKLPGDLPVQEKETK